MLLYQELTTLDEIKQLRAEHIHINHLLADAGMLPQSTIDELTALQKYIGIRLINLRHLKD